MTSLAPLVCLNSYILFAELIDSVEVFLCLQLVTSISSLDPNR
jgi:hypothetical protein